MVELLVARRLLAMDEEHLEIAHEALLTAWPRLARWLEDDAVGKAVRRHLAPAAHEWDSHGRPADELYSRCTTRRGGGVGGRSALGCGAGGAGFPRRGRGRRDGRTRGGTRSGKQGGGRPPPHPEVRVGLAAALVLALVAAGLAVAYERTADDRAAEARLASTWRMPTDWQPCRPPRAVWTCPCCSRCGRADGGHAGDGGRAAQRTRRAQTSHRGLRVRLRGGLTRHPSALTAEPWRPLSVAVHHES